MKILWEQPIKQNENKKHQEGKKLEPKDKKWKP